MEFHHWIVRIGKFSTKTSLQSICSFFWTNYINKCCRYILQEESDISKNISALLDNFRNFLKIYNKSTKSTYNSLPPPKNEIGFEFFWILFYEFFFALLVFPSLRLFFGYRTELFAHYQTVVHSWQHFFRTIHTWILCRDSLSVDASNFSRNSSMSRSGIMQHLQQGREYLLSQWWERQYLLVQK